MILPFTTFISFLLISSSWGLLTKIEFENSIESICLKLDENQQPYNYINGQENPLASTLENFIALAEKFELANPHKELKDELFYFIRSFTYNNIEYTSLGDIVRWTPKDSDFKEVENMWEKDENLRKSYPQVEDPFTEAEKCSLFFMISHSIVRTSRTMGKQRANVMILNGTSNNKWATDFEYNNDDLYPLEHGVVAIMGTNDGVDLGRLLTGMYVGLKKDRTIDINTYEKISDEEIQKLTETKLDPLYALTIAEVIVMSVWRGEVGNRQHLANDSYWISAPIGSDIDPSVCPVVLRHKPDTLKSAYSYSSLRGAADGLILGKVIGAIESRKRDVKLSQILRQYYSRGGFVEKIDGLGDIRASFCNRESLLNYWEKMIQEQVRLFILLVSTSYKNVETDISFTWNKYIEYKGLGVLRNNYTATKNYCEAIVSEKKLEDLPKETPLDVIVVLDTDKNDEANFHKQQWIIGSLAKRLSLSHGGSRMTVFTDQRIYPPSSLNDITIDLREIVDQTYSQACAACYVTQASIGTFTRHPEQSVIVGVNQYLTQKKANETKYNGVNGKVLILFNFDEDVQVRRPTPDQDAVIKALQELRLKHRDVSMYALGKNIEILKRYARNDPALVMQVFDEKTDDAIAEELYKRVIVAPAKLQYPDCIEAKREKEAAFEGFVTPNSIQHWSMPAEYFYKSIRLKITFESSYGKVKVCHSRSNESPEWQGVSCHEINSGSPFSFEHNNPCEGFNQYTCSPFYFAVIGLNATDGTDTDYCDDKAITATENKNKCQTLDQIRFKISHEGIRCSGSVGLMAAPLFLLFAFIVSHLFSKLA